MTREAAVTLVQQVMNGRCADDEIPSVLDQIDGALGCPSGYVSDLIFWPEGSEPTAAEVVDRALAYPPFAL